MKSRIIKKHRLEPGTPGAPPPEGPLRIPGRRVHLEEADAPPAEARRGVLRRDQVQETGPVPLDAEEWAPDFPVDGTGPGGVPPRAAEALRAEWEAEWEEHLEAERKAIREAAFAEGYEAGRQEQAEEAEAEHRVLLEDLSRLEGLAQRFLTRCEPQLIDLAFEIAQAVLGAPLPPEVRRLAERALTEAVEALAGEAPLEVSLHPVDLLRLQESGLVGSLESLHPGLRWEPNPEFKQGEWIASSPAATVRRLEQELLATLRDRLSLLTKGGGES